MIIIADTTPLIYLHHIGKLDLLKQLFGRICIPEAVSKELQQGQHAEPTIPELEWVEVTPVQNRTAVEVLTQHLDLGEAEVLVLALERSADRVIIDDSLARTAATLLYVPLIGTLGILITSKDRGLVATVKESLDAMMAAGLWITPALYEPLLRKIGER